MLPLDDQIRVRVPKKLKARLSKIASDKFKSITEVTREAILAYIQSQEQNGSKAA